METAGQGNSSLARDITRRIRPYQHRQPWREEQAAERARSRQAPPDAPGFPATARGLEQAPACARAGLPFLLAHVTGFACATDRAARAFDAWVPSRPTPVPGFAEPRFFLDNDAYAWLTSPGTRRLRRLADPPHLHGQCPGRTSHALESSPIWSLRAPGRRHRRGDGPPVRAVELAGVGLMPLFQFALLAFAFIAGSRRLGWGSRRPRCRRVPRPAVPRRCLPSLMPDHHGLRSPPCCPSFPFSSAAWDGSAPRSLHLRRTACRRSGCFSRPRARPGAPSLLRPSAWHGSLARGHGLVRCAGRHRRSAAAASPLLFRPDTKPGLCAVRPGLWRPWPGLGTAVAAAAWLLEYAPNHFAMRLEVNHPLHWLAWLGSWKACACAGARRAPPPAGLGHGRPRVAALTALPLAIAFGPDAWHSLHDPLLQRLHARFIHEFQPGLPDLLDHLLRFAQKPASCR